MHMTHVHSLSLSSSLALPAQYALQGLCIYMMSVSLSVYLSVCPSMGRLLQSCCWRFAAVGSARRRYRSIAAAAVGKCGECHVVSICSFWTQTCYISFCTVSWCLWNNQLCALSEENLLPNTLTCIMQNTYCCCCWMLLMFVWCQFFVFVILTLSANILICFLAISVNCMKNWLVSFMSFVCTLLGCLVTV